MPLERLQLDVLGTSRGGRHLVGAGGRGGRVDGVQGERLWKVGVHLGKNRSMVIVEPGVLV